MTKYFLYLMLLLITTIVDAKPMYETEFDVTIEQITRVRVINNSQAQLDCYVAIDGYKIKFVVRPKGVSRWYKATDSRLSYSDFSISCEADENSRSAYRLYEDL